MNKQLTNSLPAFIFATTILPLLFVLSFLLFNNYNFSKSTTIYLVNSLGRSLGYSLVAYLLCLIISSVLLLNLQHLSNRMISIIILFLVCQLQLGVIPKLYGYLGAYSISGFWGLVSDKAIFSYSTLGVSISLFFIYSPYFLIPFLGGLRNHSSFTKIFIIQKPSGFSGLILLLKIYRTEFVYSSLLFFALSIMDFTCSDLVGGGKYDTYGKALYKTAVYFGEYFPAFVFGSGVLLFILFGLKKARLETK